MKRILYVFDIGGAPISYILPRMQPYGEIYAYLGAEPDAFHQQLLEKYCNALISPNSRHQLAPEKLTHRIIEVARQVNADAIVTFDEFYVIPTAGAATALNLRGAGPNARRSRDKWQMRMTLKQAGLPMPEFRLVSDEHSLATACDELGLPFLIKPTCAAGSIGHSIIQDRESAFQTWQQACRVMQDYVSNNQLNHIEEFQDSKVIAEQILQGTTDGWYEISGYADYVSVEGIVCQGQYYPLGITSRLPTVYPFTEVGNQTPCVLRPELQLKIAETARVAIDALGLEFCGTHTEIKLMPHQQCCVIETAARFSGRSGLTRQLEDVFGVDMIGLLMEVLLEGGSSNLPSNLLTEGGQGAVGTFALLPVDEAGQPWETVPQIHSPINWNDLVSPKTQVKLNWGHPIKEPLAIRQYDPFLGALNCFGVLYLKSESPAALLQEQYNIWRQLRCHLEQLEQKNCVS